MNVQASFGFTSIPFTRELRIEHAMRTDAFDEAVDNVCRAVQKRMSACISAGAGLGKTVVLRRVYSKLPPARYDVQYLHVAGVSRRDLCRHIAHLYKMDATGSFTKLFSRLQQRLMESQTNSGQRPVLLLDEAQDLRPDSLEWIRLLTNFEMDSRLVLSVVLAGLPTLAQRLKHDEHEAIARRIHCFVSLRPLGREDISKYIEHRCVICGAKQSPFESEAVEAICEIGRGNMSAIDTLCLHALEQAAVAKKSTVGVDHVLKAKAIAWP